MLPIFFPPLLFGKATGLTYIGEPTTPSSTLLFMLGFITPCEFILILTSVDPEPQVPEAICAGVQLVSFPSLAISIGSMLTIAGLPSWIA